jgi:hypothetical protein
MLQLYTSYNSISKSLLNPGHVREQQQQTSRSSYQLYRYNHEPVSNNLLHRDIPPIIILLVFLFLIIIVLSQILVVHTSRYGSSYSSMQKIQQELKQMDDSMEKILRDNVLPIDKWRLLLNIQTYVYRFQDLFYLFNKQNHTKYNTSDNHTKKNYCNQEPSQLSMFE